MKHNNLPNLIIGGVNKAGTTSLHTYLSYHPKICASQIKEINYFGPTLIGEDVDDIGQYQKYFKHCSRNNKYILESTPKYFYGDNTAESIYKNLGKIKIIFLFRDPINRLFSYYKHSKDSGEINKKMNFNDYAEESINKFNAKYKGDGKKYIPVYKEDVFIRGIAQGIYSLYIEKWMRIYEENIKVLFFEQMKDDVIGFMKDVCNWLDISSDIYQNYNYRIENKRIKYRSSMLHKLGNSVNNRYEKVFRKYYPLKLFLRKIYFVLNEAKDMEIIEEKISKQLKRFYKPYNDQLLSFIYRHNEIYTPLWLIEN